MLEEAASYVNCIIYVHLFLRAIFAFHILDRFAISIYQTDLPLRQMSSYISLGQRIARHISDLAFTLMILSCNAQRNMVICAGNALMSGRAGAY